jgi:hypothetical protein
LKLQIKWWFVYRKLKKGFLLSSIASGKGPIAIGLSAVCCSVLAVFQVIFRSEAAEGAFFSSHIVLGTGVRFDLCKIILEDRVNGVVRFKTEKKAPRPVVSWRTNRAQVHRRVGYATAFGAKVQSEVTQCLFGVSVEYCQYALRRIQLYPFSRMSFRDIEFGEIVGPLSARYSIG